MSPLHAAAQFVCQHWFSAQGGCLLQLVHSIDAFLGPRSPQKALNAACQAGALESTLEYFLTRTTPNWREALRAAAKGGHLHVIHWMMTRQDGRGPWHDDFDKLLKVAASHGNLSFAKWLFERRTDSYRIWELEKSTQGYPGAAWLYRYELSEGLERAAANGHLAVVQWLHGVRLEGIYCDPMYYAVANGHLAIAQWLHHQLDGREACSAQACFSVQAVDEAAERGHLEVLEWLHANQLFHCTTAAMDKSARNGHFEVVKWLHRVHHECCSPVALYLAIYHGHLELVEWLYENVYIKCHRSAPYIPVDAVGAAGNGHLEVVKWVHEHFPGSFSSQEMNAAVRGGHMNVITWLHENRSEEHTKMATYYAAQHGHLEALKWFYMLYPDDFVPEAMGRAAANGHLDVVRWLHENRSEGFTKYAKDHAASNGHLDTFLYLLEHQTEGFSGVHNDQYIQVLCNFNSDDRGNGRSNRATSDQLNMLQTLFERRPAFVQDCLRCLANIACSGRDIAILDWVNQFGIEFSSTKPIREAVSQGDVKMLQWFFENGFQITDPDLLDVAVGHGQLEVVRWLSEHGYAVNSLELVKISGGQHRMEPLMRWLVEHGPPLDLSTATTLVLVYRHIEIAWWVAEKDRSHLVREALFKNDREVIWWILAHTQFRDENARRSIREAVRGCPKDTHQWFEENMSQVEACRWCFSTPDIDQEAD